nr:ABC transporter G family member 29-like [Malus domestica]
MAQVFSDEVSTVDEVVGTMSGYESQNNGRIHKSLAAFRKKEEVDLCHPLGHQSYKLVEYFEGILGVAKIKEGLQSNYLDVGGLTKSLSRRNKKAKRKRLTIAEELVAKLSIIFIDELTSGLDARVVSIIMRTEKSRTYQGAKHSITRLQ